MLVFEIVKQVEVSIRWVVKGYHECPFEVNIQVVCVASGLSAVECLAYATLKAHYIFLLIIILLSSLSVAQVNDPGVCFFAILRRHTNYLFYWHSEYLSIVLILKLWVIIMGCDHYRNTPGKHYAWFGFCTAIYRWTQFADVVFRPRFPSMLAATKKHLSLFWDLLINKFSLKVAVCHLDLKTEESTEKLPFDTMFLFRDNQTNKQSY